MDKIIGIRREDKNEWERRALLVPEDVLLCLSPDSKISSIPGPSFSPKEVVNLSGKGLSKKSIDVRQGIIHVW
jgi:hypothetical protein